MLGKARPYTVTMIVLLMEPSDGAKDRICGMIVKKKGSRCLVKSAAFLETLSIEAPALCAGVRHCTREGETTVARTTLSSKTQLISPRKWTPVTLTIVPPDEGADDGSEDKMKCDDVDLKTSPLLEKSCLLFETSNIMFPETFGGAAQTMRETEAYEAGTSSFAPNLHTRSEDSRKFSPVSVRTVPPVLAPTEGQTLDTAGSDAVTKTILSEVKSTPLLLTSREKKPLFCTGAGHTT